MSFEEKIQKWVVLDNQMKQLNNKIKTIHDERDALEEQILKYAQTNNLFNSIVKISDGKLKFTKTKQSTPLSLKYIEETLKNCIKSEEQIKYIMNHIKETRQFKIVPDIKRFYEKGN